ncbi:MAG: hypothetical protein ACLQVY_13900 [Limisphaerales bacterium]
MMEAGARISDLPGSAISKVFETGDAALTVEFLQGGITVEGAAFPPFSAWRFCREVPPEALFLDINGKTHSKEICEARLLFSRTVAEEARKHCQADAPHITVWFADALAASGH